jgi:hypothetical protein
MKTALVLLGIWATLTQSLSVQESLQQVTPVMGDFLKEIHQVYNQTFLVRRGLDTDWYKMVFGI